MDMELEYKEGILFINLVGNLNKNTTYKIYNYLIPILEKHQIKEVIYNLDKLKSIDEDGLDSILKTKWLIDRYKGIVYLNKVNKQIFGKLKRLHIKDYLKER